MAGVEDAHLKAATGAGAVLRVPVGGGFVGLKLLTGHCGQTLWQHFAIACIWQMFRKGLVGLSTIAFLLVRSLLVSVAQCDPRAGTLNTH